MTNDQLEMDYIQMQRSIEAEITTLEGAKVLIMGLIPTPDDSKRLSEIIGLINAEIGTRQWNLKRNRYWHDNQPRPVKYIED